VLEVPVTSLRRYCYSRPLLLPVLQQIRVFLFDLHCSTAAATATAVVGFQLLVDRRQLPLQDWQQ
jgi:hypothetical protein